MVSTLDTGIKYVRNVPNYIFGDGAISSLEEILVKRRTIANGPVGFFIDSFFEKQQQSLVDDLPIREHDHLEFVPTKDEPTTEYVNEIHDRFKLFFTRSPSAIVGVGGGIALDTAKAISNLLTNGGKAEDYQGWDLVNQPGVYKIGVPTLSGTGAEATRTCVITNKNTGLKLGMNSAFTVFDQLILDPSLSKTVPREQFFATGMDSYIHSTESLSGHYRNAIGDALSEQANKICRQVFMSDDMMSDENRARIMVASYLGGSAISTSYVGLVHPFSAGLSVVLGIHHCKANCVAMTVMRDFYSREYDEFTEMVEKQKISLSNFLDSDERLTEKQHSDLYDATIVHDKPLTNALGANFKSILDREKVAEMFNQMVSISE